jgi:arylsulfatase A-like enzyme
MGLNATLGYNIGSIYQGGINVPMIISGKDITRINQIENALINGTDLYATIACLAGIYVTNINDSQNFHELLSNQDANTREYIFSEVGENANSADLTICNQFHKYILFNNGSEAFNDLVADPFETTNLLRTSQLLLNLSSI